MRIELKVAAYEMKAILAKLLELYQHDASEFNDTDLNAYGRYEYRYLDYYWTDDARYAYFINIEDKIGEFALVRTLVSEENTSQYSVSEFFILRKFRRKGIGARVSKLLFDMHRGHWSVEQEECNRAAQRFGKKAINEYTDGHFTEKKGEIGPLLLFNNARS